MASFKLIYLFTLLSLINFVITNAQGDHGLLSASCSGNDTTPNSAYELNVRTLLSYLSSNTTANKSFYNTIVASRNHSDTVYGMFVCWGNIPPHLCTQCVANATETMLSKSNLDCSLSKEAMVLYEDCMIRFSNHSFFSIPDLSFSSESSCVPAVSNNQTNLTSLFSKTINQTVDEAANSAIGAKKYAAKQARISGFQTLYCEAQCTPDLSPQNCRKCLNSTIDDVKNNCEGIEVASFKNPSCRLKYDVYPFYRPSTDPAPSELIPVTNSSSSTGLKYSPEAVCLFHGCSGNETTNGTFHSNLRTLFSSLYSNSTTKTSFYKATEDTVSGLFMCRGDLASSTLCQECVLNATQRISSECPSSKEAIIWYNHCLLRYWEGSSPSTLDTTPTYHDFNILNTSNPSQQQSFFTWILANTLSELNTFTDDSIIKNYGTKAVKLNDHQNLYTLAQCTPDLSNADCYTCLNTIFEKEIPWCCMGSPEGKILYPSCYIMFGFSQFYRDEDQSDAYRPAIATPPLTTAENNTGKLQTIIIIVVPSVISLALLSFCCYLLRRKARKRSHNILLRKNFGHESITLKGLQFDSTVIKAATNNFSHENKIGKGGFGEVYKGILYDGRHVAIKRLSTFSKQDSDGFKNEVLLTAKLQHRNLLKFVGFCLEEQEKILIYEYMSNGSLEYILFDNTSQQRFSWSERYKIIRGIALGVHYLHEYSRLKIIHRDLKPNNILLDENMNPKISDFGMARIVEMNQDCGNTNQIVGTYGYMSPEYAMFGQFSEKSDVYSFGVMILEIITGKRNINISESCNGVEGLVDYVWRQWKGQEPLSVLDSNIKESYSQTEVFRCIHIGLLCVQENPNVRPTMATIISYLNNLSLELPSPQEPVFFLHRRIIDHQEIVRQQESSSSGEVVNGSTLFSTNEMSTSDFYPR